MLPMALGLGEGGEQNAPLGRSVIGGLLVATFFTLVVVPLIYSALRKGALVTVPGAHDAPPVLSNPSAPVFQPAMQSRTASSGD